LRAPAGRSEDNSERASRIRVKQKEGKVRRTWRRELSARRAGEGAYAEEPVRSEEAAAMCEIGCSIRWRRGQKRRQVRSVRGFLYERIGI
jgi:hypothetical protein